MIRFDILTLFPGFFQSPLATSMLKRALQQGAIDVQLTDIRDFAHDKHRKVDDRPYGGGAGMVMKPEPLFEAAESLPSLTHRRVILFCPQGRVFDQAKAQELAGLEQVVLLCGHYEGVDERVRQHLVDEELSIGDYVLTGGEIPALVVLDAVTRLLPGVLGDPESALYESFSEGLLDFPHYTRPEEYRGWRVPEVLLSGHHGQVAAWRKQEALERTRKRRPDLLRKETP